MLSDSRSLRLLASLALLVGAPCTPGFAQQLISGRITAADHNGYQALAFEVPPQTERLRIEFEHDGQDIRTVVDLGLYGPAGFRGASGSNKSVIEIGPNDATPSYRPGNLEPGTWTLVLGFPNVRKPVSAAGQSRAVTNFRAIITLSPVGAPVRQSAFLNGPLRAGRAWYRGDLHTHSAHSDGSCESASGRRVPCPVHVTLTAARQAGLDFVAMTDHNTTSHFNALRELQPYFDDLLLIPGVEMTSFHGHANVFGLEQMPDFFLPDKGETVLAEVFRGVAVRGGLVAVNHPGLPSGEECMGCGWSVPVDWSTVHALEVVNGGSLHQFKSAEGPFSAVTYWDRLLDSGFMISAIASSDSHDPAAPVQRQVPVGRPRTVVDAPELSQAAIFSAIRSGRSFVDVEGSPNRLLDFEVADGASVVQMGAVLHAQPGSTLTLSVRTQGVTGAAVTAVMRNGRRARIGTVPESGLLAVPVQSDPESDSDFIRIEVRNQGGELLLLSSPLYIRR